MTSLCSAARAAPPVGFLANVIYVRKTADEREKRHITQTLIYQRELLPVGGKCPFQADKPSALVPAQKPGDLCVGCAELVHLVPLRCLQINETFLSVHRKLLRL